MSNKQFLALPYGKDDFTKLRAQDCYFVDKTPYIKQVFGVDSSDVLLLTRPRRFGKTLLMSMFDSFLKINPEKPFDNSKQLELFKGTKILEDKEFCDKFMGQCPVIAVSLKDMEADTFEEAYKMFADIVWDVSKRYFYLLNSNKLDESDKVILRQLTDINYLEDINNSQRVKNSLKNLATFLYKEYGRQPILLIDEYDVPLAKASYHDLDDKRRHKKEPDYEPTFHKRMVTLMSGFLGVLKNNIGNESPISKTVITGCLKVAKNSIFTGVNNLNVNTVISTDMDLTGIIGFTKDETYKFLEDYEMDDYATDVKNNYDGYKFCDKEMFCPWDVVNFIKENYKNNLNGHTELVKANNYWANSSSDSALGEYLGYLTDSDTRKMQDLVDGKSISFILNDSMNYDSLSEHDPNDFWSLLLHTGYLTLDWDKSNNKNLRINTVSNNDVFVRIPNLEIKNCFKDSIQRRFNKEIAPNSVADEIATALLNGDNSFAQTKLRAILMRFISLRDNATKAPLENYYHGYLNGLFTNCSENFFSEYHSNNEAGNGYSDISFADTFSEKAVIIELKVGSLGSDLVSLSKKALSQIEEKNYAEPFLQNSMTQSIFAYGIAFSGKNCLVACKKLK
ncbi:uncharacterized protein BN779_00145 [Succinatimonas sp. CAG:777]|nr:uncharacterized protein BN779_00145 [Succinatimonas sp. CAG:777]